MNKKYGFTIVELLIAITIISIISAIAIPAYNGYLQEAYYATARTNASSLRLFLEDHQLDNGTYVVGSGTYDKGTLETNFGWKPDGDNGIYSYDVTATATSWSILVQNTANDHWMRCEDRMSDCCYSDTPGATTAACPSSGGS